MRRLVLIGAGQIGSRHLQGLARVRGGPLRVQVVEPDQTSANRAQGRLREVLDGLPNPCVEVEFVACADRLCGDYDLAIVATSSAVRRLCVQDLLARCRVNYLILEKVLFQAEADYTAVEQLVQSSGTRAWVNCSRRIWPCFLVMEELLKRQPGPVDMLVTGTNWGLGCNAIHMFDLLAFLTGETELGLDLGLLDLRPIPSKRPGFLEFRGLIRGRTPGGSTITLLSNGEGKWPLAVAVVAGTRRWLIQEDSLKLESWLEQQWAWKCEAFRAPLQSKLTSVVVEKLLESGTCGLTTLAESTRLHLQWIRALNDFLSSQQGTEVTQCPIT